jgi:hypothetical protein
MARATEKTLWVNILRDVVNRPCQVYLFIGSAASSDRRTEGIIWLTIIPTKYFVSTQKAGEKRFYPEKHLDWRTSVARPGAGRTNERGLSDNRTMLRQNKRTL